MQKKRYWFLKYILDSPVYGTVINSFDITEVWGTSGSICLNNVVKNLPLYVSKDQAGLTSFWGEWERWMLDFISFKACKPKRMDSEKVLVIILIPKKEFPLTLPQSHVLLTPRYLVYHYSQCFCEDVFQIKINT